MMNKFYYIILLSFLLLFPIIQAQENYYYYAYPGLTIPPEGEPGVADTIDIPDNILIEDINFYVGIATYTAGGQIIVSTVSPLGAEVVLHNHNPQREYLDCWFDTEQEEDGPGDLDDYVGYNAIGQWIMRVDRWADHFPFIWQSWIIEVVGEPLTGVDDAELPLKTGLHRIYPNPFNSHTVIHFSLASRSDVALSIYDITGQLVKDCELRELDTGYHQLAWNATNDKGEAVASGVYFARLTIADLSGKSESGYQQIFSRKLTLLK
jgi:hypothetical protein